MDSTDVANDATNVVFTKTPYVRSYISCIQCFSQDMRV